MKTREGVGVWFAFKVAADEVERHLGLSWGGAQKTLIEACRNGELRTQPNLDGHGPDVWDIDFWPWLTKPKRTPRSQTLVRQAIAELGLPADTPTSALEQAICKWHTDHGCKPPSRDTILRATGRRR
jgi:hypothetical protein